MVGFPVKIYFPKNPAHPSIRDAWRKVTLATEAISIFCAVILAYREFLGCDKDYVQITETSDNWDMLAQGSY